VVAGGLTDRAGNALARQTFEPRVVTRAAHPAKVR
jgi:hypothetical protein